MGPTSLSLGILGSLQFSIFLKNSFFDSHIGDRISYISRHNNSYLKEQRAMIGTADLSAHKTEDG